MDIREEPEHSLPVADRNIEWESAPEFGRRGTLLRALERLREIYEGPVTLVETGTLRDEKPSACQSDGWSTLAWGWFAEQTGSRVYTVDIDPAAIEICRRLTSPYASRLEYVCGDSLEFFRSWNKVDNGAIHFLYLDSFDYIDKVASEAHHLAEAEAALPAVAEPCLVLFDDTEPAKGSAVNGIPTFTGKGARAIPYLLQQGFRLEWCADSQVLLSRGAVVSPSRKQHTDIIDEGPTRLPAGGSSLPIQDSGTVVNLSPVTAWWPGRDRPRRHVCDSVPHCELPRHFASVRQSPEWTQYISTVLRHCPRGGRSLEIAINSGFDAVWLSQRGVRAAGVDHNEAIVARARQVNSVLAGNAQFSVADPFQLYQPGRPRYNVIHHQSFLEHFPVPWIRALLAQQVASADWVVFSVPSVHYPDADEGDERLLPIEEWERILAPFHIDQLGYYGNPGNDQRDYILAVLHRQVVDEQLLHLMQVAPQPYRMGISAIVHTRNEVNRIADCLQTLLGWTDEIIVCDMESTDDTVPLARRYTDQIISHPVISNFDRARNVSAMRAGYRWIFYLDADERVPADLGKALRDVVHNDTGDFDAMLIPFRHHFAGHWLRSLYPGYTMPRLFRNGRFHFNARPHCGAQVDGRMTAFPADKPELALIHYSYDSLSHYLDKLNRYTDGESANMERDGQLFHWQNAIRHFVTDFRSYYDYGSGHRDGKNAATSRGLCSSPVSGLPFRLCHGARTWRR